MSDKKNEKDDRAAHLQSLVSFMQRKGFVWGPEPEIYGGLAGFYTYGPLGKLLKNRIENIIRKTFQSEEFFEVECPIIMERKVWEASGHLGNFTDPIITCKKCSSNFRVDKLIEEHDLKIHGSPTIDNLAKTMNENKMQCPSCKNPFGHIQSTDIKTHNLMMKTQVGIDTEAYNRPETATTTYLPYPRYTDFFRKSAVFGVFQIGKAFRNEISPRQHILRMREFTQAEGQLFIRGDLKNNFEKFKKVENNKLPLWTYHDQEKDSEVKSVTLKHALEHKVLKNQAYAWILHVGYSLFKNIGIPEENIRLRQHFPDEKAFYADDAWDLEIKTKSFGWVEAIGIHDRTNYDLTQHAKFSGTPLEVFDEETKTKYVPHILEIAFGTDRPVFCILDNFYEEKEKDDGKTTLKLPYQLSPIQVSVFPLMKKDEQVKMAQDIFQYLSKEFTCTYDAAGAIGRRYLRAAESGTAYCLTVDFDTATDKSVTIRDRDTEMQKRIKIDDLKDVIRKLLASEIAFDEL